MKTKIEITEGDIKRGKKESCYDCPIAIAIKRSVTRNAYVSVEPDSYCVGDIKEIALPEKAKTFITRFDKGKTVKPFSFVADIHEAYLK